MNEEMKKLRAALVLAELESCDAFEESNRARQRMERASQAEQKARGAYFDAVSADIREQVQKARPS